MMINVLEYMILAHVAANIPRLNQRYAAHISLVLNFVLMLILVLGKVEIYDMVDRICVIMNLITSSILSSESLTKKRAD